jgi:divalent metal cation (Fe/Co/Zn/Cd) transporter
MNAQIIQIGAGDRANLVRRGRRLEYFTIAYNSLEGLIALIAGLFSGSIALIGFGFDSLIEVTSGAALVWRLSSDGDESRRERIEKITLRIIGVCFLLLAAYVSYDSIKSLIWLEEPHESIPGIILAIDPLAALMMVPIIVKEGIEGLRGETCCEDECH